MKSIKKYPTTCKLLAFLHRLRYRWCGAEVVDAAGGGAVGGWAGPARLARQAALLQVASHSTAAWTCLYKIFESHKIYFQYHYCV